jgi:hypothetical protein
MLRDPASPESLRVIDDGSGFTRGGFDLRQGVTRTDQGDDDAGEDNRGDQFE